MHIVHLTNSLAKEDGGPALMCRRLARRQAVRGHEVTIVSPDGASQKQGVRIDAREHGVDIRLAKRWRGSLAPGMIRRLPNRPDVVHVHGMFGSAAHAAFHYALKGVPVIVRPCGMLEKDSLGLGKSRAKDLHVAAVEAPLLERAAFVHVTSDQELRNLAREEWKARARVIPLGIDMPAKRPARNPAPNQLIYYSRLHEKKRPSWVLDYVAQREEANVVFCGMGTPDLERKLKEQVRAQGTSTRVRFLGHVDERTRDAQMAQSVVMVLPSKTENFAQVVVEAWGQGLPVVMCSGVALAPLAQRAEVGAVAVNDVASFTRVLDNYLRCPRAKQEQHEQRAFDLAKTFGWPRFLDALDAMYKESLK